jgi:hypothetical protein
LPDPEAMLSLDFVWPAQGAPAAGVERSIEDRADGFERLVRNLELAEEPMDTRKTRCSSAT